MANSVSERYLSYVDGAVESLREAMTDLNEGYLQLEAFMEQAARHLNDAKLNLTSAPANEFDLNGFIDTAHNNTNALVRVKDNIAQYRRDVDGSVIALKQFLQMLADTGYNGGDGFRFVAGDRQCTIQYEVDMARGTTLMVNGRRV